jgi:hypothetical protein
MLANRDTPRTSISKASTVEEVMGSGKPNDRRGNIFIREIRLRRTLAFILILALLTGCTAAQLQQLERKVKDVQTELYASEDAVLLDQISGAGPKKYVAPGCIVAYVEMAYGVDRPLAEVIDEYYKTLIQDRWELNPEYELRKTDEDMYLRRGTQQEVVIYSYIAPLRSPSITLDEPQLEQFETVYVVALIYSEPSSSDCRV